MRICQFVTVIFCLTVSAFAQTKPTPKPTTKPVGFAQWEKKIASFEEEDKANPPAKGGIVFTGSSTIVRWKTLAKDYPGINVINRAFGGSQIFECTHFVDRLIFPYEPKMVILRAGGNDIHAHKSAEQVFNDYKDFVAKVRTKLPDATIVYISMAPAPVRWSERDENKKCNELIKQYSEQKPGLKYIETYDLTITPDGQPREDLFVADRLHPNAEGYRLLADRVRPFLPKD